MSEPAAVDVVVYGATGFTGRLVCHELARRGASFAIAGRDEAKLAALADTLRPAGAAPEILRAPLDDAPALERAVARGRALLACAGPFARLGRPLVDAALATGRHYLDITGETPFILDTWARDAEARARGVVLVNAVGFDVVPTDCAAVLAAEAAGAPVEAVRIGIAPRGGRPTQGTTRSALAHLGGQGGLAYVDGEYRTEAPLAVRWRAPFPQPLGPRDTGSAPWGDLATAPRSTGARRVRTFFALPSRLAPVFPLLAPAATIASRLLSVPTLRELAERCVDGLPEGPSEEARHRARFSVVAEADGAKGTRAAWVTGGDPYDFTAVSAVECALRAAAPAFDKRGALTPTQAFGARSLLETLAASPAAVRFSP